ncbi:MAG: phosphoribosylformylglycinamidine synthase subunit PurL, partial [Bacteroidetes bacterium]|nr:phosphoribosylformylglycinamidine synthase subunit PurL [Bacteroidota bacterium]
DCNGRYVYLNPYEGTKIAVAEAARNIVCSGAVPLAITNCLNFGNPYKPEMYWNFQKAIEGMGDACRFFDTPVTGGNVSFYNESPINAVYPTPVIGMIGLIEDIENITTSYFKNEGDYIFILGEDRDEIGGSEYLKIVHGLVKGDSPKMDLQIEKDLHTLVLELIGSKVINSAHDISEGGLACALAECCILNLDHPIGAELKIPIKQRADFTFFSESQSRIIVSVSPEDRNSFEEIAARSKVAFFAAGRTGGNSLKINDQFDFSTKRLIEIYYNTISKRMNVTI